MACCRFGDNDVYSCAAKIWLGSPTSSLLLVQGYAPVVDELLHAGCNEAGLQIEMGKGARHRFSGGPLPVDVADGAESPVFDLLHQQAAAWVEDDEVGMYVARAERYVVPEQPVVFELLFEAVCKAPLAACHVRHAGADCRYQRSQGRPLMLLYSDDYAIQKLQQVLLICLDRELPNEEN